MTLAGACAAGMNTTRPSAPYVMPVEMSLICATTPPGTAASWSTSAPSPWGSSGLYPLCRKAGATAWAGPWIRQKFSPARKRGAWLPRAGTPVSSSGRLGPLAMRRAWPRAATKTLTMIATIASPTTTSHASFRDCLPRSRQLGRQRLGSRFGPKVMTSTDLECARSNPAAPAWNLGQAVIGDCLLVLRAGAPKTSDGGDRGGRKHGLRNRYERSVTQNPAPRGSAARLVPKARLGTRG